MISVQFNSWYVYLFRALNSSSSIRGMTQTLNLVLFLSSCPWSHKGQPQTVIMSKQRWWSALTDARGWRRRADRCSGVTGSTWPCRGEPFGRRWGSPLLRWGASCLSQAAKRSPTEEKKRSAGQTPTCMITYRTIARGTVSNQLQGISHIHLFCISTDLLMHQSKTDHFCFSSQLLFLQLFSDMLQMWWGWGALPGR